MHLAIRGSEILLLEGATHGAVIEYPDEVNAAVLDFLERALSSRRRTPAALR
jgi:pimeloyl-ACP methyl ester carboxylesterase